MARNYTPVLNLFLCLTERILIMITGREDRSVPFDPDLQAYQYLYDIDDPYCHENLWVRKQHYERNQRLVQKRRYHNPQEPSTMLQRPLKEGDRYSYDNQQQKYAGSSNPSTYFSQSDTSTPPISYRCTALPVSDLRGDASPQQQQQHSISYNNSVAAYTRRSVSTSCVRSGNGNRERLVYVPHTHSKFSASKTHLNAGLSSASAYPKSSELAYPQQGDAGGPSLYGTLQSNHRNIGGRPPAQQRLSDFDMQPRQQQARAYNNTLSQTSQVHFSPGHDLYVYSEQEPPLDRLDQRDR